MGTKKLVAATLAGAVTAFLSGFLLYGLALAGFFEANVGSAAGVMREPIIELAVGLGQIPVALFLTLAIDRWGDSRSPAGGAKVGALFGFFVVLGFDLTIYGTTNVANFAATLVDPIVGMVLWGASGAVIGMVLARGAAAAP